MQAEPRHAERAQCVYIYSSTSRANLRLLDQSVIRSQITQNQRLKAGTTWVFATLHTKPALSSKPYDPVFHFQLSTLSPLCLCADCMLTLSERQDLSIDNMDLSLICAKNTQSKGSFSPSVQLEYKSAILINHSDTQGANPSTFVIGRLGKMPSWIMPTQINELGGVLVALSRCCSVSYRRQAWFLALYVLEFLRIR